MYLNFSMHEVLRCAQDDNLNVGPEFTDATLVTRDNRSLDIPVAVQHVAQHIVQA